MKLSHYLNKYMNGILISIAILTVTLWTIAVISIMHIDKQIAQEKQKLELMK